MRHYIRRKLFLSHFLAVLLVSGSVGTYFYFSSLQRLTESIQLRLESSAALIGQITDAGELETIRDAPDHEGPIYERSLKLLRNLARTNSDIAFMYVMRQSGGRVFFVLDSDESELQALPGREYTDHTPALMRGFQHPSVDDQVYEDEWGIFISGYSPLRNGNGEYLVGLDMRADELNRKLEAIRLAGALSLIGSILLALLLSHALSIHFTRPIKTLVEHCQAIARGGVDYAVQMRSGDELEGLMDAFNSMSRQPTESRVQADAAQKSLRQTKELLELRVAERTQDLTDANERLLHEVAERARAEEKLVQAARTDPLTGLMNRRAMLEQLEFQAARFRRTNATFSVLLADLDRFKHVNDLFGHDAGDRALVETAEALSQGLRPQDLVSRWGGEEFLCLLPDSGLAAALVVAERIRARVATQSLCVGDNPLNLTLSIGVASFGPDQSVRHCIKAADVALYQAKRAGRDRVVAAPSVSKDTRAGPREGRKDGGRQ
ncbi:MAG: diguanylate cyclase [Thiohalocapsa sp.]